MRGGLGGQTDSGECGGGADCRSGSIQPEVHRAKFDIGLDRVGKQLLVWVLKGVADFGGQVGDLPPGGRCPIQEHFTAGGSQNPVQQPDAGALAGAIAADQRHALTFGDLQVKLLQRDEAVGVGETHLAVLDGGHGLPPK